MEKSKEDHNIGRPSFKYEWRRCKDFHNLRVHLCIVKGITSSITVVPISEKETNFICSVKEPNGYVIQYTVTRLQDAKLTCENHTKRILQAREIEKEGSFDDLE